jgi:hypothetical protein
MAYTDKKSGKGGKGSGGKGSGGKGGGKGK